MWLILHTALAVEPATCPPAEALLPTERWLRAASLDLRGVIPSEDDYQQITDDALPEALIDTWLDSPEFTERAIRHHRSLLWPGFTDLRFVNNRWRITPASGVYRSRTRDTFYRGTANTGCGDFEATFTDGVPDVIDGEEGWVRVHPFWEEDPAVTVKVCALDAQDTVTSANGVACNTPLGGNERTCGCGPELEYCVPPEVLADYRGSLAKTLDARLTDLLDRDAPYTDLLTADTAYLNGPLVHFFQKQSYTPSGVRIDLPPIDPNSLPDLPYSQSEFVPIPTHAGHSGVLTDTAFLVRFMTNRARVNQFYNSFLCQPFTAPAGGITGLDVENPSLDLSSRDGCDYCHSIVEPETAYWTRWTEGGAGYLDPMLYPAYDPECAFCSETSEPCDSVCRRYYTVDPLSDELDPFVGSLRTMQFLPEAEHHRVDDGPAELVARNIANGKLQSCVTEKAAEWLLGRDLRAEDGLSQQEWQAALVGSSWDYRELVKAIVLSESYRRSR